MIPSLQNNSISIIDSSHICDYNSYNFLMLHELESAPVDKVYHVRKSRIGSSYLRYGGSRSFFLSKEAARDKCWHN